MNYLVGGKLLETIGALFIAYVAVRACALEMKIGYNQERQSTDLETQRRKDDGAVEETEKLRKGLRQVLTRLCLRPTRRVVVVAPIAGS